VWANTLTMAVLVSSMVRFCNISSWGNLKFSRIQVVTEDRREHGKAWLALQETQHADQAEVHVGEFVQGEIMPQDDPHLHCITGEGGFPIQHA